MATIDNDGIQLIKQKLKNPKVRLRNLLPQPSLKSKK